MSGDLRELLARLAAGEDADRLDDLVARAGNDAAARNELARMTAIDGLLGLALEDAPRRAAFADRVAAAVALPEPERFATLVLARLHRRRRWARVAAIAATLLVTGAALALLLPARLPATMASLERLEAVAWSSGAEIFAAGQALRPGDRLRLDRGLIDLQLADRGRMVVEGPIDLELSAIDRAVLRAGRLVMTVTERGHGYRVETPTGTLIDLGTRFAVAVAEDGIAEAHVLQGAIAAIPRSGAGRVILEQDSAVRFAAAGLERMASDRGGFYTALPPVRGSHALQYVRWSLDEGAGGRAQGERRGFAGLPVELDLRAVGSHAPPGWCPAPFASGLAFDGAGGYAESGFPGIPGKQPRTVACWIRVPRDFTPEDGYGVVAWGDFSPGVKGAVWQVSINPTAADGPLGRLRVGTHGGRLVGATDLRDGAWHHVAVVMYGGDKPDIGTHVLLYLDGELEAVSRRALYGIDTRLGDGRQGVWIGRDITNTGDARDPRRGGFFRGAIDEVLICDQALTREEIIRLRDANQPPGR